jgi:hypothetical protein
VQVHTVGLTQAVPDKVSALRTGCGLGREYCIRHARSKENGVMACFRSWRLA